MSRLNDLKKKLIEVEETYHRLKADFDAGRWSSRDEMQELGFRLDKFEKRYFQLRKLVQCVEDGDEIPDAEINSTLGIQAKAAAPTSQALRLPLEMTKPPERAAALDRQQRRQKAASDLLTPQQHKRLEDVDDEYSKDASALVEGLMETFQQALDDALGKGILDRPVAFTQGRSYALTGVLASLWANQKIASHIAREQLAALEDRITELEARPAFEDAGVWANDKTYRLGHGVTEGGSYWIAKRPAMFGERPGTSDAWRLAVKRGRDGKDVRA